MFYKTSSRIKQFILLKKDKKTSQEDDPPPSGRRKFQVKAKSCIYQDQESIDASVVRRTNSSPAGKPFSAASQRPQATEFSLNSIYKHACNATPPHSLLECSLRSDTPKRLCQQPQRSMQLVLASSETAILQPASPLTRYYQSRSTTQLDLLEALALEPGGDNDRASSYEYLTPWKLNSDNDSKDTKRVSHTEKYSSKVPTPIFRDMSATNSELCLEQGPSKPLARNLSLRTEPQGRFQIAVRRTVPITQYERLGRLQDDCDDREDSNFMKSMMLKPPALSNSPETLERIRKRLSAIHSRQRCKHNTMNGRAQKDRVQQLRVQTCAEDKSRQSSETSYSTESASTGSTLLEPFHLEDLPLRIRLAAGFLTERQSGQHIQIRHSRASTIAPQSVVPSLMSPSNVMSRNGQAADISEREVILRSTNYSLTSSGFRHGNIRLKRRWQSATSSKIRCSASESNTFISSTDNDWSDDAGTRNGSKGRRVDNEMDLPRFQITISGSTSCNWGSICENFPGEDPHPALDDREVKFDELLEWWSYMDLDAGAMLQRDLDEERWEGEPQNRRCQQAHEGASSSRNSEITLAPPEIYQNTHTIGDADGVQVPASASYYEFMEDIGENSKVGSGDEKCEWITGSEASLSPSPMQSIDPITMSTVDTFVPMGFNVDHDLVDFLRCRSEGVQSTIKEL